eukprot:6745232-Lingulodinium_polyedra.AAC.1
MEPSERYQKALEALAEARAKKQRAERHAREAQELLQKATEQEQQAQTELDEAKAGCTNQPSHNRPDPVSSTAAKVASEVYGFMAKEASVQQDGSIMLTAEAAATLATKLK